MERDTLINKLLFSIENNNVPTRTALEQAYAAGRSKKGIPIHSGKEVIQCDRKGRKINSFENVAVASREVGVYISVIYRSIKFERITRRGHIWKYADNGDDQYQ